MNHVALTNTAYAAVKWGDLTRNACSALQHTATHCNALRHTATQCNTLQHSSEDDAFATTHSHHTRNGCNTLQHTVMHYNALQRSATHCNTLQHTATHCNTLQQHTATHCNTLQHTATFFRRWRICNNTFTAHTLMRWLCSDPCIQGSFYTCESRDTYEGVTVHPWMYRALLKISQKWFLQSLYTINADFWEMSLRMGHGTLTNALFAAGNEPASTRHTCKGVMPHI